MRHGLRMECSLFRSHLLTSEFLLISYWFFCRIGSIVKMVDKLDTVLSKRDYVSTDNMLVERKNRYATRSSYWAGKFQRSRGAPLGAEPRSTWPIRSKRDIVRPLTVRGKSVPVMIVLFVLYNGWITEINRGNLQYWLECFRNRFHFIQLVHSKLIHYLPFIFNCSLYLFCFYII